jgi:phage RecT family recombinase
MSDQNVPQWKQALTNSYPKFKALNPERAKAELGFAMSLFQSNQQLQKCDPTSILNSVVSVARTSITLNPVMRLAYLIPRKGVCILEFSYMGLVALLRDNGCIRTISAHIVYSDEKFENLISENRIIHIPTYAESEKEHNMRKIIGCYSRATLPTGDVSYEFMPMWEIEKVKKLSKGADSQYSAWKTWEGEMIKKSVIKRHFKLLISTNTSEALHTALKIENDNNQLINSLGVNNTRNLMTGFDDIDDDKNQTLLFEEKEKVTNIAADNNLDDMSEYDIITPIIKDKISDDIEDKELDDLFQGKGN